MPGLRDRGEHQAIGPSLRGGQAMDGCDPMARTGETVFSLQPGQIMATIGLFEEDVLIHILFPDQDEEIERTQGLHLWYERLRRLPSPSPERIGQTWIRPHIPACSGRHRTLHTLWMERHIAMYELAPTRKTEQAHRGRTQPRHEGRQGVADLVEPHVCTQAEGIKPLIVVIEQGGIEMGSDNNPPVLLGRLFPRGQALLLDDSVAFDSRPAPVIAMDGGEQACLCRGRE